MKEDDKNVYRTASRFLALGLEMGISIGAGYLIGSYLDKYLMTSPFLTIFFFIAGLGAAVRAVYSAVKSIDMDKL
ncbi:MAG: AtpZ/AtpI family protein [Deltaproteobacteria bacterium]|nr:AtpZ/AtpI family protein [Deltaproteobacteria bacterium]